MKKLFLLLAVVGMTFTACETGGGLDENGNGNNNGNTEQPGSGQGEEPVFITDNEGDIVVEAKGCTVVVTVSTNLEYSVEIPEEASAWLSIADTRAIRMDKLTFTVAKNEADSERSAIVKLLGNDNAELQSLSFVQKGASAEVEIPTDKTQAIEFQDENTKLLCTLHWDENEDGELSYEEAAAVTDLGTAFKGSSILAFTELKYFTGLETIANNAFEGCVSLVKITFPEQLATIGVSAFKGCNNLKKITIPDGVTSIGDYAFCNCSSLTSVTIPDSVTSIEDWAFSGCSSLTSVTIGNGVTSIGDYAFSGCSSLTSVTIPDSVTSIGSSAFSYCSSLTSVTISDKCSVTSIEDWAFSGCNISDTYVNISDLAAYTANNNTRRFPGNKHLLVDGTEITELVIPDGVTSIGNEAFNGCSSLTSVTILNSVTSIGDYAFCNCSSLTSVTIPNSVTSIGYKAFSGCSSLTSVTIPDSVTSIGEYAFWDCTSLTSVTIGNSVTSIGEYAFDDCRSLTSVDISDLSAWCKISFSNGSANPLRHGAKLYLNGSELTDIAIPSDITEIKDFAFYSCTSLTSVAIGNSVTSIGGYAFYQCYSLTSVTIGNSVTSIGGYAFEHCTSLTSVYCKPTTPPTAIVPYSAWDAFYNNASGRKIYVPRNSVNAYKYAMFWNNYASYIVGYDF